MAAWADVGYGSGGENPYVSCGRRKSLRGCPTAAAAVVVSLSHYLLREEPYHEHNTLQGRL